MDLQSAITGWLDWGKQAFQITQGYGPTDLSLEPAGHGLEHWHEGIDFAAPVGTPVTSPVPGTIVFAGSQGVWGNWVDEQIGVDPQTGKPIVFSIGHLDRVDVKTGQQVGPGTQLGLTGNTGVSTGPHALLVAQETSAPGQVPTYGSDVDPGPYLFSQTPGSSGPSVSPATFSPWDWFTNPGQAVGDTAATAATAFTQSIGHGLANAGGAIVNNTADFLKSQLVALVVALAVVLVLFA